MPALFMILMFWSQINLPDGPELEYIKTGQGQPLLLLSDSGDSMHQWHSLEPLLSERYTVIRMNLRGIGKSTNPGGLITLKTLAGDAAGLMKELGFPKYNVAGHGLGSFVAMTMVAETPQHLEHIILLGSSPGGPDRVLPDLEVLTHLQTMLVMEHDQRVKENLLLGLNPSFVKQNPEIIKAMMKAGDAAKPSREVLARHVLLHLMYEVPALRFPPPVLILHGADDRMSPVKNAHLLHRRVRGSRLEIVNNAGHLLMIDQPVKTAELMVHFLSDPPD